MDIETQGLGAGSYPEPPAQRVQFISGKIYITYEFKDFEFPEEWTLDEIKNDIKENVSDYIYDLDGKIEEIEI